MLYEVERKAPPTNSEVILTGKELFQTLASSDDAIGLAQLNPDSITRKAVVDVWDHEIHAKFTPSNNTLCILLWSDGPNRKNENCKGDDIVRELNISPKVK
jgi:hypothetical protein